MTGGSVVATVYCRGPPRDQFYLSMAYLSEFVVKIAYFVIFQIKLYIKVKEVDYLLGNQAHGAMYINAAV